MKIKRNYLIKIAPAVLLVVGAYWLLGSDFFTFLIWWEMICLLGLVFMPVTSRIFRGFDDNGWMFSKVLAVAVCGYVQWLLACLKITPFTGMTWLFVVWAVFCMESNVRTESRILFPGNRQPWFTGKKFCFFWCFFSGHIWRDFIRRLMERKNIWILVLCSP